jgi:hypothetical protein
MRHYMMPLTEQAKLRRLSHRMLDDLARRRSVQREQTAAREAESRAALRTALQQTSAHMLA